MRYVMLLCIGGVASLGSARAALISEDCKIYYENSASAPDYVIDFLKSNSASFVSVCKQNIPPGLGESKVHYYAASKIESHENVCHFDYGNLIKIRIDQRWILERTGDILQRYMLIDTEPCPRVEEMPGDYIASQDVPLQDFKGIIDHWTIVSGSIERLSTTLASLSMDSNAKSAAEGIEEQLKTHGDKSLRPFNITLLARSRPSSFELYIRNISDIGKIYLIDIVGSPGNYKVVNLSVTNS